MVSHRDNQTDENTFEEPFPLSGRDLREAAALHVRELGDEFLTRLGERFIARYYRAFVEGSDATALGVRGEKDGEDAGRVVGVVIGASDARAHYSYLVRYHGFALGLEAVLASMKSPALAADLIRTRLSRYVVGLFRVLLGRGDESPGEAAGSNDEKSGSVGFVVYVAVQREEHRSGAGRNLLRTFEEFCRKARSRRVETATRPDGAGERFFTALGWERGEERVTRSGERYVVFHRYIAG